MTACLDDVREDDGLAVGDALPSFSVSMNDGTTITTTDLMGHSSVIMFFSVTCPDCQAELPVVQRLWNVTDRTAVPIILIARGQRYEDIEPYWQSAALTMIYSPQSDWRVYNLFAKSRIPRIYINDSEGVIRYIHTDAPLPSFETLQEEIRSLR